MTKIHKRSFKKLEGKVNRRTIKIHKENPNSLAFHLLARISNGFYFSSPLNSAILALLSTLSLVTFTLPWLPQFVSLSTSAIFSVSVPIWFSFWLPSISTYLLQSRVLSLTLSWKCLYFWVTMSLLIIPKIYMAFLSIHSATYRHQPLSLCHCVNFSMVRATSITKRSIPQA